MVIGSDIGTPGKGRVRSLFVVALASGLMALVAAPAASAEGIEPCDSGALPEPGSFEGTLSLSMAKELKRSLSAKETRLRMISPASRPTGAPEFPIGAVNSGDGATRIRLDGGMSLIRKGGRKVAIKNLSLTLRPGKRRVLRADVADRRVNFLLLRKVRVKRTVGPGAVLEVSGGRAVLTRMAGRVARNRMPSSGLKPGMAWARPDLFATQITNPTSDPPPVPEVFPRPDGALDLTSAEIEWRPRESFIQYVASGDGTAVSGGAEEGPAEERPGMPDLVYSFSFPFGSGWAEGGRAAVLGSGTVGFRYCRHTINFTVSDPEIELDGRSSRLIFKISGTDGTSFGGSRAVVLELDPTDPQVVDEASGTTRTIRNIPARVPAEATGIFAGLYLPGAPFGEVSVSFEWAPSG